MFRWPRGGSRNLKADSFIRPSLERLGGLSMATRVGINGFGRIGRLVVRATLERYPGTLEVAAVNDLTDAKTNAHLFKYDTNYGVYQGQVEANNGDLVIDGRSIKVFSERDPAQIPWSDPSRADKCWALSCVSLSLPLCPSRR